MKKYLYKNNINYFIKVILFLFFLIIIYENYHLIKLKNDIILKERTINTFKHNLYVQKLYEGKKIWNIWNRKKIIRLIVKKYTTNKPYLLLVYLKNISCFACFDFHIDNLKHFNKTPVLFFSSKNNGKLIKSYLPNTITITDIFYKIALIEKIKNLDMMIFFINKNGRILFVTRANKNNMEISKTFYKIVSRLVRRSNVVDIHPSKM